MKHRLYIQDQQISAPGKQAIEDSLNTRVAELTAQLHAYETEIQSLRSELSYDFSEQEARNPLPAPPRPVAEDRFPSYFRDAAEGRSPMTSDPLNSAAAQPNGYASYFYGNGSSSAHQQSVSNPSISSNQTSASLLQALVEAQTQRDATRDPDAFSPGQANVIVAGASPNRRVTGPQAYQPSSIYAAALELDPTLPALPTPHHSREERRKSREKWKRETLLRQAMQSTQLNGGIDPSPALLGVDYAGVAPAAAYVNGYEEAFGQGYSAAASRVRFAEDGEGVAGPSGLAGMSRVGDALPGASVRGDSSSRRPQAAPRRHTENLGANQTQYSVYPVTHQATDVSNLGPPPSSAPAASSGSARAATNRMTDMGEPRPRSTNPTPSGVPPGSAVRDPARPQSQLSMGSLDSWGTVHTGDIRRSTAGSESSSQIIENLRMPGFDQSRRGSQYSEFSYGDPANFLGSIPESSGRNAYPRRTQDEVSAEDIANQTPRSRSSLDALSFSPQQMPVRGNAAPSSSRGSQSASQDIHVLSRALQNILSDDEQSPQVEDRRHRSTTSDLSGGGDQRARRDNRPRASRRRTTQVADVHPVPVDNFYTDAPPTSSPLPYPAYATQSVGYSGYTPAAAPELGNALGLVPADVHPGQPQLAAPTPIVSSQRFLRSYSLSNDLA